MKVFTNKVGVPTIVVAVLVLLLALISLPNVFNYFRTAGAGYSYAELMDIGVLHEEARVRAIQDGIQSGILMVLGQHIPITMLVLIAVGLISKSTTVQFKKTLRILYFVVVGTGILFLSFGSSYWGQALPFPLSLGPSIGIYIALSIALWAVIGIGILIRGK